MCKLICPVTVPPPVCIVCTWIACDVLHGRLPAVTRLLPLIAKCVVSELVGRIVPAPGAAAVALDQTQRGHHRPRRRGAGERWELIP